MKNALKGILSFVLSHILLTMTLYTFCFRVSHPFAKLYNTYDATAFLSFSSLLLLPIYLLLGALATKLIKLTSEKKSLVAVAVICGVALSAMWLILVVSTNTDHSAVLLYALLNMPAGWAYGTISTTSGYLNSASLLFTILPPVVFVFGVYLSNKRFKH